MTRKNHKEGVSISDKPYVAAKCWCRRIGAMPVLCIKKAAFEMFDAVLIGIGIPLWIVACSGESLGVVAALSLVFWGGMMFGKVIRCLRWV